MAFKDTIFFNILKRPKSGKQYQKRPIGYPESMEDPLVCPPLPSSQSRVVLSQFIVWQLIYPSLYPLSSTSLLLTYFVLFFCYSARSRIIESAACCNQISLASLYINNTQNTSVNWIIRLLLSLLCGLKVILLSGGHYITILKSSRNFQSIKWSLLWVVFL